MILSMLSRGLGRPGSLTLATPDFFWDVTVLQNKIKKCLVRVLPREGTSGVPDLLSDEGFEPKSTQKVKNQSWVWLFLEGSIAFLTTSRVCGDHREPPHGRGTVRTRSCEIAQG